MVDTDSDNARNERKVKTHINIESILAELECGWEKSCQRLGYTPLNEEKCGYTIIRVCLQRRRFEKHLIEYFKKGSERYDILKDKD